MSSVKSLLHLMQVTVWNSKFVNRSLNIHRIHRQLAFPVLPQKAHWFPPRIAIRVWLMNADGSNHTNLTNNPAGDDQPAWSPDGTKIAFYSASGRNTDIWVMNADGTDQTKITNNGGMPAWSPDGRITFIGEVGIWIMNAEGSDKKILMPVGAGSLAWSPDGSRIAIVSDVAISRL